MKTISWMESRKSGRFFPVVMALGLLTIVTSWPSASHAIFEDYEYSPRARGLGGAYAGLSGDAIGIYYNPAGLVNLEGIDTYVSMFELWGQGFLRVNAYVGAVSTENWGTFGVGYTDFRVEVDDTVLSAERTWTVSQAIMLMEDIASSLAFGYAINLYQVEYGAPTVSGELLDEETTFGIDLGVQARFRDRTTAGVFFENVNNPDMGNPPTDLPQRVSGGVAYRPYDGVITVGEIEKQVGEEVQFRAGVEFEVAPTLVLRFGASNKPNLLDIGAGLKWDRAIVDFTYTHHPVLNPTLHIGAGARF